jgi:hypothetical protein
VLELLDRPAAQPAPVPEPTPPRGFLSRLLGR